MKIHVVDSRQELMQPSPGNPKPGTRVQYSLFVEGFSDDQTNWDAIEADARSKVHTHNGYTVAFYFDSLKHTPKTDQFSGLELDERFFPHCIAGYWHYPNGETQFKRNPLL